MYPASSLQKISNSRFYITEGAAKNLKDVKDSCWFDPKWNIRKKQKALLKLSRDKQTFGKKLSVDDFKKEKLFKSFRSEQKYYFRNYRQYREKSNGALEVRRIKYIIIRTTSR